MSDDELPFTEPENLETAPSQLAEDPTTEDPASVAAPQGQVIESSPAVESSPATEPATAKRLEPAQTKKPARGSRKTGGQRPRRPEQAQADPGADLERRAGRTEFNDGALVRLRVPIRVDADTGRDVLTDIDVLAIDVDGRLRLSRSILECKSGKGQAGEPDRLLWLSGLQRFLGFERAVLVRQTVSRRGRGLARDLGLRTLDMETLAGREKAHAWIPERFAHIDGPECSAAELRSDTQLKALGHIPSELVAFLRYDALRAEPHRVLRAIASLGRAAEAGGVLPNPTRVVLAGHALIALIAAALADAGRLDEISAEELLDRTRRALVTGNPDDDQVLQLLSRADEVVRYSAERVHAAYKEAGVKRPDVTIPSLKETVSTPPDWVPRYVDLVEKLRANPAVSRQMLQTTELAVFEALVGGNAHESPAFDHLFTQEHRYMLNVARRCLADIAGAGIGEAVAAALDLDFGRGASPRADRDANPPER
ncbi:hypothetical protein [Nocardioides jishulii]|uniref:Uncharacterized protein n=1 Tax=Nocardioides jishulii TaxID=2575440 RepID=A0A4V5TK82_9ACTN|nr:hypothetical protein [Nocardioides jishulii]QCX27737.1 hypothetical protein FCL41_09515 [Nocardioides jishulii]TKI62543.1 hypothetical protein FC770_09180 [Nocardioides jishulii]